eukprot:UN10191
MKIELPNKHGSIESSYFKSYVSI